MPSTDILVAITIFSLIAGAMLLLLILHIFWDNWGREAMMQRGRRVTLSVLGYLCRWGLYTAGVMYLLVCWSLAVDAPQFAVPDLDLVFPAFDALRQVVFSETMTRITCWVGILVGVFLCVFNVPWRLARRAGGDNGQQGEEQAPCSASS